MTILTAHSPGVTSCLSPVGPILIVQATGMPTSFITSIAHSASSIVAKNCKYNDMSHDKMVNYPHCKTRVSPVISLSFARLVAYSRFTLLCESPHSHFLDDPEPFLSCVIFITYLIFSGICGSHPWVNSIQYAHLCEKGLIDVHIGYQKISNK